MFKFCCFQIRMSIFIYWFVFFLEIIASIYMRHLLINSFVNSCPEEVVMMVAEVRERKMYFSLCICLIFFFFIFKISSLSFSHLENEGIILYCLPFSVVLYFPVFYFFSPTAWIFMLKSNYTGKEKVWQKSPPSPHPKIHTDKIKNTEANF